MILRPKSRSRHPGALPDTKTGIAAGTVPAWLRRAVSDAQSLAGKDLGLNALEDLALAAGAAIGALDAVVRRQERWAGVWRQRLALAAAARTVREARRVEDEAALRDAVLLTKAGDDAGPAGHLLLAWRRLATRPAEELLSEGSIAGVLDAMGLARDDETAADLADELRQLAATEGAVGTLVGAFAAAERYRFGRAVGAWLADVLVAQRLGWAYAVPLLGAEVNALGPGHPRRSGTTIAASIEDESARAKSLLVSQARAALRAVDLSAELGRRAEKLLSVVPKLRARGAELVVEKLLDDDAITGSARMPGMSDRGLRRLFDRLVELGAIRELTGRPTFRIYGL